MSKFEVRYYPGCGATKDPCKDLGDGSNPIDCFARLTVPLEFRSPEPEELDLPTVTIDNFELGAESTATFVIQHSEYLPTYGGVIKLTMPTWYGETEEKFDIPQEYVFTETNTECSSNELNGIS